MQIEKTVKITIDEKEYEFPYGSRLSSILDSFGKKDIPIVAAFVNGYVRGLYYTIIIDCEIKWIDLTTNLGRSIYRNGLRLMLVAAHNNVLPERTLYIKHTLGDGSYCESRGRKNFTEEMRLALKAEMQRLIKEEVPIEHRSIFREDAKTLCRKRGLRMQEELVLASSKDKFNYYEIDSTVEAFHGTVVTNCSRLPIFDLTPFDRGFILRAPTASNPNSIKKDLSVAHIGTLFLRFDHWAESLKINNVGELNYTIRKGNVSNLIEMAETMQIQNIFEIVKDIHDDIGNIRVLLIAGPSSSGKTTFSHKLSLIFKINGIEPLTLSTDDYFVDRSRTPKDKDGNYDFESIECVDLQHLNKDIEDLISGKTVETPIFDFLKGGPKKETRKLKMTDRHILIIEGIHCLNERLAANISPKNKRRIYMSVLTQLNLDRYNPISGTDIRLLRRMTRDKETRNTSPAETIMRWESVQRGENINITPFRENADYFLNTSLIYEMAVLKPFIEPTLKQISAEDHSYNEAKRLLSILDMMLPIDSVHVPPNSLLREFIGDSAFSDHS